MEDLKTRIVVVSDTNKVVDNQQVSFSYTTHQLKTKQIESEVQLEPRTVKQTFEEVKEAIADTQKVKDLNPFHAYFPSFYKKEIKNTFINYVIWGMIFLITLGLMSACIYFIVVDSMISNWVMLLLAPPVLLVSALFIVYATKYYNFRGEARTINFKDEKVLSVNVQKLYKRLKTGHININWFSAIGYIVGGLTLLITLIVAFIVSPSGTQFGDVSHNKLDTYAYLILFYSSIATLILTLIIHVSLLVSNYIRAARIENFYNFMIVPQEEINELKKQKNRRDMIIFLIVVGLVGFIGWFIYKIVKRNKTTQVIVK